MASESTKKQERLIDNAKKLDKKQLNNMGNATLLALGRIDPETMGSRAGEGRRLKKAAEKILKKRGAQ